MEDIKMKKSIAILLALMMILGLAACGSGPAETASQKSAVTTAQQYLAFAPFSYQALVEQWEYGQVSETDAVYAADHCGADWNQQALNMAAAYLGDGPYSYTGLVGELEGQEFTADQATYAADHCGADWNAEAAKAAAAYLARGSYSRAELISRLRQDGFTNPQAVLGATAGGVSAGN